jgi:hypothetical protein
VFYGSETYRVFERWWAYARDHDVQLPASGHPQWVTMYRDPIIDYRHRGGPPAGIAIAFYLAPQQREPSGSRLASTHRASVSLIGSLWVVRPVGGQPVGELERAFARRMLDRLDRRSVRTIALRRLLSQLRPR